MKSNLFFLLVIASLLIFLSCGNNHQTGHNSDFSGKEELPDKVGDSIVYSLLDDYFRDEDFGTRNGYRVEFFITKYYLVEALSRRDGINHENSFIIFKGELRDTVYTGRIICYPDSVPLPEDNAIIYNKDSLKLHVYFHESRMKSILGMMEDHKRIICRYVLYPDSSDYVSFHYYREPWE